MTALIPYFKASCYALILLLSCIAANMAYGQQIAEHASPAIAGLRGRMHVSFAHKMVTMTDSVTLSPLAPYVKPIANGLADFLVVRTSNTAIDTPAMRITESEPPTDEWNNEEEMAPLLTKYAEMVSLEPQELVNYPLYEFIDHWYGTRYKYGGDNSHGIDCSAFSKKLYDDVYCASLLRTSRQQHKHCERVDEEDVTEGDLVFFRMRWRISHVGVYLANGYFVHASRSRGVVISSLGDKYWRKRFAGYGRMEKEEVNITESGSVQQFD
ncbi:MAG: NlpC/P60 family protein [Bacteroidota bacterium]